MIRRLEIDDLRQLAEGMRCTIAPDEEEQFKIIADAILGILETLDNQMLPRFTGIEAVRDAGRRPEPDEDPYNAIVRWCRVKATGAEGVLSGKRIALKDSVAVATIPLTCGSRVLESFIPETDCIIAERILRAGGEIVAMTNMDDLGFSGGGDSSFYGPTLNPFDVTRTAGGSSGGSAACLYYDCIDVSIGCDQGGSIRLPAAWCGAIGLKPTYGLVPYTGIVGIDQSFDHVGPMALTVADVAALLQAIAGKHESDPRQPEVPALNYIGAVAEAPDNLDGMTLGVVTEGFFEEGGDQLSVAVATEGAINRFAELGANIRRISLPEHLQAGGISFASFIEGMTELMTSGGNGYWWRGRYWTELPAALGPGLRDFANDLSPQVKIILMLGAHLRRHYFSALYAKAQNLRPWLLAAHDRAFGQVDALLMPTSPAIPHIADPDMPVAERVLRGWAVLANLPPTSMTGHPALTIPAAEADGLPVGVMLIGRHFSDDKLLALAATYEQRFGWLPPTPPLARRVRAADPGRRDPRRDRTPPSPGKN